MGRLMYPLPAPRATYLRIRNGLPGLLYPIGRIVMTLQRGAEARGSEHWPSLVSGQEHAYSA